MKIERFIEILQQQAWEHPGAEVRMETFNYYRKTASMINEPSETITFNEEKNQLTIVGEGIPQNY